MLTSKSAHRPMSKRHGRNNRKISPIHTQVQLDVTLDAIRPPDAMRRIGHVHPELLIPSLAFPWCDRDMIR